MLSLPVDQSELRAGRLNDEKRRSAAAALRSDGIVALEDIVDLDHLRVIRDRTLKDVEAFVEAAGAKFNWNRGNIQQEPPPFPPFLFRDILANDIVIQVTRSILGKNLFNGFYSGNTALPGESRQPVHADLGQLWPNQATAHPAYGLVINVPLVDVSPENGSTEIWPGTHLDTSVVFQDGDIEVAPARVEQRRATTPPFQPTVRQGSVIIRDLRLWHAGMPNRTSAPRPMLAMIHYVNWWTTPRFTLHRSAEDLLRHPDLRQHAAFTDDQADSIPAASKRPASSEHN